MTSSDDAVLTKRQKLRDILERDTVTVMPGGFSPLYARMAEVIGFECYFIPGSQMAAFLIGVPDNGILGLRDMVDHARHAAARTGIPVQLDADTGFGNAVNVHYAVQEIVRAGVAAMNIEDQEAPKKSAPLAGRRCIPMEEMVGKVRAAVAARDEIDPAFCICARNDTLGAEGSNFAEALERCQAYAEAGADYIWLNSVETRADLKEVCEKISLPIQVIWGGREEPAPSPQEFEDLGARIALYPVQFATAGMQGAWYAMNDFYRRGPEAFKDWAEMTGSGPGGKIDQKMLIGADKIRELEEEFLTDADKRDYDTTWGHGGQTS